MVTYPLLISKVHLSQEFYEFITVTNTSDILTGTMWVTEIEKQNYKIIKHNLFLNNIML